ncbi:hypothetical protein MIB92_19615 [Aestuariirhabdus sp. Z084]|uniref:hypothetical protein n=1 Tax=Aestuariirhabdus haliotis TaxID=2918751 RepID=UPI00201B400A|nr:hypothetical protein [Aestuariirhabdus haliotis]MCL6417866.1 hypothetical protein [Aestuariirhabdus haliotis]MCL6421752.1 hypothetical protein [Aestuariirhabdus haliotis]
MNALESRKFVILATIVFATFAGYAVYLELLPDVRLSAGPIGPEQMYWWEFTHWLSTAVLTLALFVIVMRHAYANKKYGWLAVIVLLWPLLFVYAWRHFKQ